MPLEKRDQALLLDILEAALQIRTFTAGMDEAAFLKDAKTQRAVERDFEIIGEAARSLSSAAEASLPKIPFRKMRGLRNLLAHEYGSVNPSRIWQTASEDLPALIKELR